MIRQYSYQWSRYKMRLSRLFWAQGWRRSWYFRFSGIWINFEDWYKFLFQMSSTWIPIDHIRFPRESPMYGLWWTLHFAHARMEEWRCGYLNCIIWVCHEEFHVPIYITYHIYIYNKTIIIGCADTKCHTIQQSFICQTTFSIQFQLDPNKIIFEM